jgi:DNA-binding response OmpR family regulator
MNPENTSARKLRVFVVDDEPALAESLKLGLQAHGFEVETSRSFEDARRRLLAGSFDVLITDVRLGAFNGLQLAVIARGGNPSMRIVVFSGFDDSVLREEARALNASYLVKPVSAEQMKNVITANTDTPG